MSDNDTTQKTGIAKTGTGALAKGKSLAEQAADIESARDADVERRKDPHQGGVGKDGGSQRYNPHAIEMRPKVEASATERRENFLAKRGAAPEGDLRMRYSCISCGWNATIEFDPSDPTDAVTLEEIGGDIARYSGPCPADGCGYMTLVPFGSFDFDETLSEAAAAQKRQEAAIMTEGVLDTIMKKGGDVLLGAAATAAAEAGIGDDDDQEDPGKLTSGS